MGCHTIGDAPRESIVKMENFVNQYAAKKIPDPREIYSLTKAISLDAVSVLFEGNEVVKPSSKAIIRVMYIEKPEYKLLKEKMDLLANVNSTHQQFLYYSQFGEKNKFFYGVIRHELIEETFLNAIDTQKFVLTEQSLRELFKEALLTLHALHTNKIVHGRIDPFKLLYHKHRLFFYDLAPGYLTPTDRIAGNDGVFFSPEMHRDNIASRALDVWGVGSTLHYIISGSKKGLERYMEKISQGKTENIEFLEKIWDGISTRLKDLIGKMLNHNSSARITIEAALKHEWFTCAKADLSSIPFQLSEVIKSEMKLKNAEMALINKIALDRKYREILDFKRNLDEQFGGKISISLGDISSSVFSDSAISKDIALAGDSTPICYMELLMRAFYLNAFCEKEKLSTIFNLLSLGNDCLGEPELRRMLETIPYQDLLQIPGHLQEVIKNNQAEYKEDLLLNLKEFISFCSDIEFYPPEDIISGKAFCYS